MCYRVILLAVGLIGSCAVKASDIQQENHGRIYDLNQSTNIIIDLLRTGELGSILEEHTAEQADVLIKNFSPALMAFEAEVLSCTMPVLLYFYRTTDANKAITDAFISALTQQYDDRVKVVAIDADLFFSIAQAVDVANTPAFGMCRDRNVEISVTGSENIGHVNALIQ